MSIYLDETIRLSNPLTSIMYIRLLLLALLILAVSSDAQEMLRVKRDNPAPKSPRDDPFYVPKDGWKDEKPGTILDWRHITPGFTKKNKMKVENAYQILYRTSGTDKNDASFAVTTIIVPNNPKRDKLVMVMPYQDSNFIDCSPSYKIQLGAPKDVNPIQSLEELLWTSMLNDGWILTIPDHEGPKAAFTSSFVEGHASLDALRATLNFDQLNYEDKTPIVGVGYSGGAIAGGWAASLHDKYAPELNVVGWALGGTPTNLSGTFENVNGGLFSGFSVAGIAGLVDTYPGINDYVGSVATQKSNDAMQFTRENCMADIVQGLKNVTMTDESFFTNGNDFLYDDRIVPYLRNLSMGTDKQYTPKAPVYMYHAKHDEVIPFERTNETATAWCENGANILFQEYTGKWMGHITTEVLNTPFVLKFIRDRMDGAEWIDGCKWKSALNPLWEPGILGARFTELFNMILNLFGARVGRTDDILKESIRRGNLTGSN